MRCQAALGGGRQEVSTKYGVLASFLPFFHSCPVSIWNRIPAPGPFDLRIVTSTSPDSHFQVSLFIRSWCHDSHPSIPFPAIAKPLQAYLPRPSFLSMIFGLRHGYPRWRNWPGTLDGNTRRFNPLPLLPLGASSCLIRPRFSHSSRPYLTLLRLSIQEPRSTTESPHYRKEDPANRCRHRRTPWLSQMHSMEYTTLYLYSHIKTQMDSAEQGLPFPRWRARQWNSNPHAYHRKTALRVPRPWMAVETPSPGDLTLMPSFMDPFAASIRTSAPHRRLGVPSAATTHRPIRSLTCVDTSQDAWVPCPRCEGQSRLHGMSPCPIWFASRAVEVRLLTLRAVIFRIEIRTGYSTCSALLYRLSRPDGGCTLRMRAPL